ncbi:MAG: class I SAM-dependent methyltransferase [Planctomycetota bacterium]|jgi:SAM-dependent methyltransferase
MTTTMTQTSTSGASLEAQGGKILSQVAGYVGVRAIAIGLRSGLFAAIAKRPEGVSAQSLADELGLDPFYVAVWARSAYAAEVLELETATADEGYDPCRRRFTDLTAQTYTLAAHMQELLLDERSAAYVGGMPQVLLEPEMFDVFEEKLATGERLWWDECSPRFLQGVSRTGGPFYARLVPDGLERIPGLAECMAGSPRVMELCCGAGRGLVRLAQHYPDARLTGVDGDAHSLSLAGERVAAEGCAGSLSLHHSSLEDLDVGDGFDVVLINISMHECRDIDKVAANVLRALRPGGVFVISDFSFPSSTSACRTTPARIMGGIQFFEALIDDQLLPTRAFLDVLERQGFEDVGSFDLAPVHAVSYGRKPGGAD